MLQFRPLTVFPGDDMVPLQELLSSMLLDKCCHTCHIEGPCLGVQDAGTKVLLGLHGPSNRCGTDGASVEGVTQVEDGARPPGGADAASVLRRQLLARTQVHAQPQNEGGIHAAYTSAPEAECLSCIPNINGPNVLRPINKFGIWALIVLKTLQIYKLKKLRDMLRRPWRGWRRRRRMRRAGATSSSAACCTTWPRSWRPIMCRPTPAPRSRPPALGPVRHTAAEQILFLQLY